MLGTIGMALLAAAAVVLALAILRRGGALDCALARYARHLDAELDRLCVAPRGRAIAGAHAAVLAAVLVAAVATSSLALGMLMVPVALAPATVLASRRAARIGQIEQQLPTWLVALSNALQASPAIADALASSARLQPGPIAEEVDRLLKSVALGTPLDEAIRDADRRVGSATFSGAMTALRIGRQTGGELPAILEGAAGTLREMERLSGVVRTRTAEAKTQAYALAGIPFLVAAFLQAMDDTWFPQFLETGLGTAMLVAAGALWLGSIAVARRILAVDM